MTIRPKVVENFHKWNKNDYLMVELDEKSGQSINIYTKFQWDVKKGETETEFEMKVYIDKN